MKVFGPLLLNNMAKDKTALSFPICQLLISYCTGAKAVNLHSTLWGRECHSFVSKLDQNETQVPCRLEQSHNCHEFKAEIQACTEGRAWRPAEWADSQGYHTKWMPKLCGAFILLATVTLFSKEGHVNSDSFLLSQHCVILQKIAVCNVLSTVGSSELSRGEKQSKELFQSTHWYLVFMPTGYSSTQGISEC